MVRLAEQYWIESPYTQIHPRMSLLPVQYGNAGMTQEELREALAFQQEVFDCLDHASTGLACAERLTNKPWEMLRLTSQPVERARPVLAESLRDLYHAVEGSSLTKVERGAIALQRQQTPGRISHELARVVKRKYLTEEEELTARGHQYIIRMYWDGQFRVAAESDGIVIDGPRKDESPIGPQRKKM
jgi:predicted transcriptional regulator